MNRLGTLAKTMRAMRKPSMAVIKPRRRAVRIGAKRIYRMSGGPLDRAWLNSTGTLPFRIGDWFGKYDQENRWIDL